MPGRELVKSVPALAAPEPHVAMRTIDFDWPFDDLGQFVGSDDAPVDKVEHVHMKSAVFDWQLDDLGQYVDAEDTPLDRIGRG